MNDDSAYAHHILDAIGKIQSLVKNMTYKKFLRSWVAQSAVIHQIEIIGEAAKRFSDDAQSARSDIPWRQIVGMRNKLIHDYMGVDLGEVWRVTQEDLAELKKQMKQILRSSR